jgi:hypothetical protein
MILHIKRVGKMNPPIDRENYNVFMGIFYRIQYKHYYYNHYYYHKYSSYFYNSYL